MTGSTLLTQSADLKEQRFLNARPRILDEVCLQSFLKVLTAIMARSGLSQAQVVRQKQIIFFMTSSFVKEALHISEKTGDASIPSVMQLITFLMTSRPFLLSLSLITPLRALPHKKITSSVRSFLPFFSLRSTGMVLKTLLLALYSQSSDCKSIIYTRTQLINN